tara:strand:- start:780 stop:1460 length:681 start_codon:yes stop_codon:yes gene_type:complete
MKSLKTSALVALMTAAMGLSAVAPSYAQQAAPPAPPAAAEAGMPGAGPMAGQRQHDGQRQGGPRGMAGFIGFERGAEAVEIALVRLSHAVDMTSEQQALFDTLKTDALAAAETFSAAVDGLRPAAPTPGERPAFDVAKGLETHIAIQTAQLEALKSVQPSLTAFFDSLTDEQKAELAPQPRERGEHGQRGSMGEHGRGDHKGPHQGRGAGPMGGADDAAPSMPNNG